MTKEIKLSDHNINPICLNFYLLALKEGSRVLSPLCSLSVSPCPLCVSPILDPLPGELPRCLVWSIFGFTHLYLMIAGCLPFVHGAALI